MKLKKEVVQKDDGRKMIYYTFKEDDKEKQKEENKDV